MASNKNCSYGHKEKFYHNLICVYMYLKYQIEIGKLTYRKHLHLFPRLLVERLFNMCLVPYTLPVSERMKRLYQMYASLDENAIKWV